METAAFFFGTGLVDLDEVVFFVAPLADDFDALFPDDLAVLRRLVALLDAFDREVAARAVPCPRTMVVCPG